MKDEVEKTNPATPSAGTSSARPRPSSFSHYPAVPPPIRLRLVETGEHACPYLPGRVSNNRAFWAEDMPPMVYHAFMDAGFRRSGKVVYQPICRRCRQCIPLRVPVDTFRESKSQRRTWRKNQDLMVSSGPPKADQEGFELYRRYICDWHGRPASNEEESFESYQSFLCESPVDSIEYRYRTPDGRLLAVGLCDRSARSLSSVYFYHEPSESRRGLGTFGALFELDFCRQNGIPYYYLGYWVDDCATMSYKASYRPYELLGADGIWRRPG